MLNKVLVHYALMKPPEEKMPELWTGGFDMPVGADLGNLITIGPGQIAVLGLAAPNAVHAWHPVFVVGMGQSIQVPLGRKIGKCLGTIALDGRPFSIFQDLPWPESTISAAKPAGHG